MNDIYQLTALELSRKIKEKELTVSDAVLAVYRRIEECESELHCYITIRDLAEVLSEAEQIQTRIDSGELSGPLAGVPIAVKDNICTKGIPSTCASRMLEAFSPPYSASVIERLQAEGLIIIGKTNMDEFGMGSTTETSAFGITRNPHNPEHSPGGSSGGSCAAVASGEAFLALGSDTGGSIRQPAAHCGVYGLKPTYGAVSRYGLVAYASSLDQIGPIGKTLEDCAALYAVIQEYDPKDATSFRLASGSAATASVFHPNQLKVGIPFDFLADTAQDLPVSSVEELLQLNSDSNLTGLAPSVLTALRSVTGSIQNLGASVEPVSFGLTEYLLPTYYIIACAEASSNLSRYDGIKYGYRTAADVPLHTMYRKTRSEAFGPEVKKRILLGTFALSSGYYDAYYLNALKAKNKIISRFENLFSEYDVLLLPVTADTAPAISAYANDPVAMYQSDLFTVAANLAGLPAISIPCGKDAAGLPVGIQLIGKRGADYDLLQYASYIKTDWSVLSQ